MNAIALPLIIPLIMMILLMIVRSAKAAQWISSAGTIVLLAVSVWLLREVDQKEILVLYIGGWEAPFGITLVIDRLSAIMLSTTALIGFAIAIYAAKFFTPSHRESRFYVFFFALLMGVNGAFITGDVFNLYVWFEVMLMSSFVLITLGSKKAQLEGAIKYLSLNLIGSMFFLAGLGLLYGKTGTLNMAHLAQILIDDNNATMMNTSAVLFFIAFGIKAAVFPLFFWLPSSYHTPNIAVTSLFAGLLTKVGVYALIRFFTLFFVQEQAFWHNLLLVVAGFTMVIGGMSASIYYDSRRILSYHIISQIGYMIMGLGIFTPLAIAGAIFFTIHNMIAKTNVFLVAGIINKLRGSFDLKKVGGLFNSNPAVAIVFIIPGLALAGVPPVSGFFAKFILIKAGFDAGQYFITAIAILTGMLTLYSMIKIWNEAFLKAQPEEYATEKKTKITFSELFPSALLALASLLLGIFASPVFNYIMKAAEQLSDPVTYISSVLNF